MAKKKPAKQQKKNIDAVVSEETLDSSVEQNGEIKDEVSNGRMVRVISDQEHSPVAKIDGSPDREIPEIKALGVADGSEAAGVLTETDQVHEKKEELLDTENITKEQDHGVKEDVKEQTVSDSQEVTPEPTAPKKRLTLQERLALAAGKPKRKVSKKAVELEPSTPRSSTESTTRPSIDLGGTALPPSSALQTAVSQDQTPEPAPIESLIPSNFKDLAHDELLKLMAEVEVKYKDLEISHKLLTEDKSKLLYQVKELQSTPVRSGIASNTVLEHKLKEREERITQLLKEGEDLSRKELKHSTLIKKLKAKESEFESTLGKLQSTVENLRAENFELEDSLKTANDTQKALLQEQTELQRRSSKQDTELMELTQTRKQLEKEKAEANKEIVSLQKQLDRVKDEAVEKKEDYFQEISRLEAKLEDLRFQTENSQTTNVTTGSTSNDDTYMKLLKQHDVLQDQYTSATENWQRTEASLQGKVNNLEYEKAELLSTIKDQDSKIEVLSNDLRSKTHEISQLNEKFKSLSTENSTLKTKIHTLNDCLKDSEDLLSSKEVKFIQEQKSLECKIGDLTKRLKEATSIQPQQLSVADPCYQPDSPAIPQQVSYSRHSSSASFRKVWDNRSDIRVGESSTTPYQSRKSSAVYTPNFNGDPRELNNSYGQDQNVTDELHPENGDDRLSDEGSLTDYNHSPSHRSRSIHGGTRESQSGTVLGGSSVQLLSKMSGQVRRLEMELSTTKEELVRLTEEKKLLNEEIIRLMNDIDEAAGYKSKIEQLERDLKGVNEAYEHTLVILGEKSEKCDELMADVDDLKDLCKLQVQQMVEMQKQ